eukprot:4410231-Lingulodinium_polyedra.AAC.1
MFALREFGEQLFALVGFASRVRFGQDVSPFLRGQPRPNAREQQDGARHPDAQVSIIGCKTIA